MSGERHLRIEGSVARGFESVRDLFEREMRTMAEEHAQLCVYYRGERVVDLWAAPVDDTAFSPDSLVNVFSCGKSLESIAMAWLVGHGLLDYAAPVTRYWPEFAANEKGELTVADVLRHEGGMAFLHTSLDPDDLLPANLKLNKVGALIESHTPRFPTGGRGKREYHAFTRGWILNELFRRVDPKGRTMGEFYEEEIRRSLDVDVIIGVRETELSRIVNVKPLGLGFQLLQSLKPRALGRKIEHHVFQIVGRILRLLPNLRHGTTSSAPPPFEGIEWVDYFNTRIGAMGETPSVGPKCSARGLAKLAAVMAGRGRWEEREVLSEVAWKAMHDAPTESVGGFFAPTSFTQGGLNRFRAVGPNAPESERAFNTGREGYYGWMGFGGSIFQWHPEREIGFAFVPTVLHTLDILDERGKVYQAEVLRCTEPLRRASTRSRA
jgi:CubicO group peptidase (beta-lactamase class C family)